jgi:tetratricopeptide (TPR) repeat protein
MFARLVCAGWLIWGGLADVARASDPVAAGLHRGIDFLERRLRADAGDFVAANQLADRLVRRQRWTGQLADLRRAEEVAARSLAAMPAEQNPGGLQWRAQVQFATHRFAEARETALRLETLLAGKPAPQQLLGDALLELGDLEGAGRAFAEMVARSERSAASESRLARVAWMRGDLEATAGHLDAALALARSETGVETLVWALLERGELAFRRGEHDRAEAFYTEAAALAPTHWRTVVHLGELRGAQGRDAEAAELLERAARATQRAELWQALGDLHAFYRRPVEARTAHEQARAGYRASLDRGEVLYVHHLAGYYSDSQFDAAQAVTWAKRDLELRQSAAARDALAWALYKSGDIAGASEQIELALASGAKDAHLLQHAGLIRMSAGDVAGGQAALREAAAINPFFQAFHVHR